MQKSASSFSEEQIRYIQKVTNVSREDLIKTIKVTRVSLDEVVKYLKNRISNRVRAKNSD